MVLVLAAGAVGMAGLASATPVYDVQARLNGGRLSLSFDLPDTASSPCSTYLRWDLRDRVTLVQAGTAEPPVLWASTFTSPTYTYNRCRDPHRLWGQPFATVTRKRAGFVHVQNARNRVDVPWSPFVLVCIHGMRLREVRVTSGVTCVRAEGT